MGLDVSHDCWYGAYSAFNRWRAKLAELAGLPGLSLMEGFWRPPELDHLCTWHKIEKDSIFIKQIQEMYDQLPIKWEMLKPDILFVLLNHSDCDGEIEHEYLKPLADRLTELLPKMRELPDDTGHIKNWEAKTKQFIDGLLEAHEAGDNIGFH